MTPPLSSNSNDRSTPATDWLQPPPEEQGLAGYVRTLRERLWLVIGIVALTTAAAVLYVVTANPTYQAEADMIIFPASGSDPALIQLPLIRESPDPTRDVETAARLILNNETAARVKAKLNSPLTPEQLLEKVTAEPVATSNIVAIIATADTPEEARDLANAFADATVAERTAELHAYIDKILPGLEAQVQDQPSPELEQQLAQLRTLRESEDPTIQVQTKATLPTGPATPRKKLSIAIGILAGLILGVAAAFAVQILDPRLRREEQLRRLYRLPILARIPREAGRSTSDPLNPLALSPAAAEAYRTLRGTLAASGRATGRTSTAILVTGSSPSEGKTTTAINLATSLAAAGNSVILVEADLRRPAIGRALGVVPTKGVVGVLIESVALDDALVTSQSFGPRLKLLLAEYEGVSVTELFGLASAAQLIDDARRVADYVIVDSPPLTDVVDALPLASYVDHVLIVTRLGNTRLASLARLGELLSEINVKPVGFVVVGTSRPSRNEYLYHQRAEKPKLARPAENTPVDGA
ncbi:MAG: tyrosine-protein kinase [Solirubrobacterales bacterium]|jgi:non-specific protein-tyrosine kinase|nr:tyrosine-protein kinase [Solirubrobacterales bacterium]